MIKTAVFSSTAALGLILAVAAGAVTLPQGMLQLDHGFRSPALVLLTGAVQPGYETVEFMELAAQMQTPDVRPRGITPANVAMPALAGVFGVIGLLRLRSRKD